MANVYIPGPESDALVDQLLATGRYGSADEVVLACLQLLQRHDAAREELLRLADERHPEIAAWRRVAAGQSAADDPAWPEAELRNEPER
jgi:putative addiction module CopG family antidote